MPLLAVSTDYGATPARALDVELMGSVHRALNDLHLDRHVAFALAGTTAIAWSGFESWVLEDTYHVVRAFVKSVSALAALTDVARIENLWSLPFLGHQS